MRIVLATTTPEPGGVWRHVADLGGGLRASGHEVTIALLPGARRLHELASSAGLPCATLGEAVRMSSDVWHLHLHDTYDRLALPMLLARRARPGVLVVTEHLPRTNASDPSLLPGGRRPGAAQAKWALKRAHTLAAHRLVTVSAASREFLAGRYGLDPGRIEVVPNGIAVGHAVALTGSAHVAEVVVVGSLIVQKGCDVLVRAVALARGPWNVSFVGAGPAESSLRELASCLDPGRIRFAGWLDDPAAANAGADVVCVPSRWEGLPYVALEAAAASRPVVASAVDGLPEVIVEGVTGRLVPPDDPAALASALDDLAAAPQVRARLGAAARERLLAEFRLEQMIERTVDIYRGGSA